eukprot:363007-Chlamydomonas_euryale.AAC.1
MCGAAARRVPPPLPLLLRELRVQATAAPQLRMAGEGQRLRVAGGGGRLTGLGRGAGAVAVARAVKLWRKHKLARKKITASSASLRGCELTPGFLPRVPLRLETSAARVHVALPEPAPRRRSGLAIRASPRRGGEVRAAGAGGRLRGLQKGAVALAAAARPAVARTAAADAKSAALLPMPPPAPPTAARPPRLLASPLGSRTPRASPALVERASAHARARRRCVACRARYASRRSRVRVKASHCRARSAVRSAAVDDATARSATHGVWRQRPT